MRKTGRDSWGQRGKNGIWRVECKIRIKRIPSPPPHPPKKRRIKRIVSVI